MKLRNVNFENWFQKHSLNHKDKWFRELYPWKIFDQIDFDDSLIATPQRVISLDIGYEIIVKSIKWQENKLTYLATVDLRSHFEEKPITRWTKRAWNNTFKIAYNSQYEFVTVFAKGKDPSQDLMDAFMCGNFDKVVSAKSIPVSEWLFRCLISELIREYDDDLDHYNSFDIIPGGVRNAECGKYRFFKDKKFSPIYSRGRDLWIVNTFEEKKAHRIALTFATQCHEMMIIYCNPTYTRHHRCKDNMVSVISFYEFADSFSPSLRKKYDTQIKLLHNYLNISDIDSEEDLLKQIRDSSEHFHEIDDPP